MSKRNRIMVGVTTFCWSCMTYFCDQVTFDDNSLTKSLCFANNVQMLFFPRVILIHKINTYTTAVSISRFESSSRYLQANKYQIITHAHIFCILIGTLHFILTINCPHDGLRFQNEAKNYARKIKEKLEIGDISIKIRLSFLVSKLDIPETIILCPF